MKIRIPSDPATSSQINYIEILCNDLGCKTRTESLSLVSNIVDRELRFYGTLTKGEAHEVISDLRERLGKE